MKLLLIILLLPFVVLSQSTNLLKLHGGHTVNVTYTKKYPERLFDNNILTRMDPDQVGFTPANPFVFWVVLDSTYNDMAISYYHTTGASNWIVRVYSDNWDTIAADKREFRFTGVFNAYNSISGVDTVSFPIRLIRFESENFGSGVTELFIYGDAVAAGSQYLPNPGTWPADPGKYFYGFSDLYPNQQFDDAGWSIRWMGFMDYIDTCVYCPPHAHNYVFSKFQNDLTDKFIPTLAAGRKIHPYYSEASEAFKYIPGEPGRNSKDIPIGADSLDIDSWVNQYRAAAAAVTNFDLEWYEVGNEDQAWWIAPPYTATRYHSPAVLLRKWKAGAAGARAAKPTVKVIGGANPFLDTSYLKAMYLLNKFSGDPWPVDGIAINDYTTTGGGQHVSNTDGVSPEQGRVYSRWTIARETIFKPYFPGNEVWQTEFGWDTTNTDYNVPDIAGTYREKTKARFYGRHWFWLAAAKMHRGFAYTNRMQGGVNFGTAGWEYVVENPPNVFTTHATETYYHLATISNEVAGYNSIPEILIDGDSTGITVGRYTHKTNPDSLLYAVFRGTVNNSTTIGYVLNLGVYTTSAVTQSRIENLYRRGIQTNLTPVNFTVVIPEVDETIQFIRVKRTTYRPIYRIKQKIRIQN